MPLPKSVRKLLFYLHLATGSLAGVVILIMSVTGVLLAYQRQIVPWVDRDIRSVASEPGEARISAGMLLAKACKVAPVTPSEMTLYSRADRPAELAFGTERTVYLNSYTGDPIGIASQKTRSFFRAVEGVHRWLGAGPAHRPFARMVTGVANLAFLVLLSTGLFLWLPTSRTWRGFLAAVTWRWNQSRGRTRYWNWHAVTGFWCAIPLLVIVSCGVVMSFPWANNLLYRVTGGIPPAIQGGSGGPADPLLSGPGRLVKPGITGSSAGSERRESGKGDRGGPRIRQTTVPQNEACGGWDFAQIDTLWAHAERQAPGWRSIALRVPASGLTPAVFTIDEGDGGRPDKRSQLILDWRTGATLRWEPFSSYNEGRRLRSWIRFSHTGEAAGFVGQTIAALATLGVCVLAPTGLLMTWKRFWRARTRTTIRRKPEARPTQ